MKILWNFLGVLHPVAMDRATSLETTQRIEAFPGVHDWTSHAGHCLKNLERDKNHSSMKAFEMIQWRLCYSSDSLVIIFYQASVIIYFAPLGVDLAEVVHKTMANAGLCNGFHWLVDLWLHKFILITALKPGWVNNLCRDNEAVGMEYPIHWYYY